MSSPPPGSIVSLPEPPKNSSDEPPPVRVSSPAPPMPVISKGPTSPTLMLSFPPSPLACIDSLEPMSIENGTRLGRSNLIRPPLGWTVKTSPAAGAPLTSTSSRPSSPLATPVPPFMVSLPRSPTMRSSPPPPLMTSLASPPRIRSAPSEPLTVSAPAPPSTLSSVAAPTPLFAVNESSPPSPLTSKRSVAASNVNRPRFDRRSCTVPPATGSIVKASPSVAAPLTSEPSLPACPSAVSDPSPWFQTSVSLPAPPCITSSPLPATSRSLPSPPVRVSLLSGPVITSSPASPLSPELASWAAVATTVSESFPPPPLTMTVCTPSAATVWLFGVALSQSAPLASPPVAWPCTSRPPDTDTVTLSLASSRLSVAVRSLIDAEVTAASAGTAVAAKLAASVAASTASVFFRLMPVLLVGVGCWPATLRCRRWRNAARSLSPLSAGAIGRIGDPVSVRDRGGRVAQQARHAEAAAGLERGLLKRGGVIGVLRRAAGAQRLSQPEPRVRQVRLGAHGLAALDRELEVALGLVPALQEEGAQAEAVGHRPERRGTGAEHHPVALERTQQRLELGRHLGVAELGHRVGDDCERGVIVGVPRQRREVVPPQVVKLRAREVRAPGLGVGPRERRAPARQRPHLAHQALEVLGELAQAQLLAAQRDQLDAEVLDGVGGGRALAQVEHVHRCPLAVGPAAFE